MKTYQRERHSKRFQYSSVTLALVIVTVGSIFQIDFTSKTLPIIYGSIQHQDKEYPYSTVVTMDDSKGGSIKVDNLSKTTIPVVRGVGVSVQTVNGSSFEGPRLYPKLMNSLSTIDGNADNIIIVMRYPRNDRMGSNLQRPLNLMAYAHCKGYKFCVAPGRLGSAEIFGFPVCPHELDTQLPYIGSLFETSVNQSGIYSFQRNDGALLYAISENIACAYSSSFRRKWRDMILNIPYLSDSRSAASQELFYNDNTTMKIAVHIRRGDISSRHPIYISDATFIATIRKLKQMLSKVLGKDSQVHVFSEDYGDTNWTAYGGELVDYFHLAPQMNQKNKHTMDIELNLRDWKHFITADILVVGGTFSRMASYARDDPDSITGLPLTVTLCYDLPCRQSTQFDWSGTYVQFQKDVPDDVNFINLPYPFDSIYSIDTTNVTIF